MTALDTGTMGKRRRGAAQKTANNKNNKKKKNKKAEAEEPKKTFDPPAGSPFMSIQAAGKKFFGLSKNGSYDAAERGDFGELYEVGRRKFVVVPVIEARIKDAAEARQHKSTAA